MKVATVGDIGPLLGALLCSFHAQAWCVRVISQNLHLQTNKASGLLGCYQTTSEPATLEAPEV